MFVFYQHHKDPSSGKTVLTELRLSSSINSWSIAFYNEKEKTLFEALKPILKMPDAQLRSYNPQTNIWSYFNETGPTILEHLVKIGNVIGSLTVYEVENLELLASQSRFDYTKKQAPQRPDEFFYNYGQPSGVAAPSLSRDELRIKLAELMQVTAEAVDKKSYRLAAMRLHPDRNNGDGSRMSDLNMYWRMYNG